MDLKYREWVHKNGYNKKVNSTNNCNTAVRCMKMRFPELTVQVGYANGVYHCWLRNDDGDIIDPTHSQFGEPCGIRYKLIAERFLDKDEIESSTGAIFLNEPL